MKYIICDIDGTLADSTHRNHKLPGYMGKSISLAVERHGLPVGTPGTVFGRRELDGCSQTIVDVRWAPMGRKGTYFDQAYLWDDFMHVTGQNWHEWHTGMREDDVIAHTGWLLQSIRPTLLAQNMGVLFLTARWNSYREDTLFFLQNVAHVTMPGFNDALEMRPVGDERKDTVMKGDILDRYQRAGHEFFFAIEDRHAVAQYLRGRGIPTFHMADSP